MPSAVPPCSRCHADSVAFLRYCGLHLCGPHLMGFVDERVSKEVRKQGGIPKGLRIMVACSGGKDSTVALHAMHRLTSGRQDVELVAVTVDEGIQGYRPGGLSAAQETTRALGVEHVVKRVRDFANKTMDEIQTLESNRGACSYCGVFRRRLMNEAAVETGADLLVTGHNLDDLAQSILMNLSQGELDRLSRLGPHTTTKPGLVPRRMPLRTIPELEVYLYAMLAGYAWHDDECPYAAGAQRTLYRDMLARMEDAKPGTRHAVLRTHEALAPLLARAPETLPVGACGQCGEPASGTVCQACRLRQELVLLSDASP